jgi:signal transduction histidine kinase
MLARRLTGDVHSQTILHEIVESIRGLEALVDALSDYAANQPPHCEPVVLKRLVDEIIDTLRPRLARQKVAVEINVPPTLTLRVDRRMMASALRHLTLGSLAAMPAGGQLVVTAVTSRLGIELEIADSGPGLSQHELPRAFAATHQAPAGASGMERAIARQVVAAHGGQITARNCPEGGTALTLLFPAHRAQQAA